MWGDEGVYDVLTLQSLGGERAHLGGGGGKGPLPPPQMQPCIVLVCVIR